MIDGDFPPSFPLELALKDARLALAAAEESGLRLGALAAVAEQMERAVEAGHGKEDMAATIHASRRREPMADALIIVDYQNDFARPDGALSVPAGEEVAGRINELAASGDYELVVATRDWHPPDHGSFTAQGGIWPVHCVQGTDGAELHPALDTEPVDAIVDKGQDPGTEGYSAFDATALAETLRARGVDAVTVVGLATDYCVKNTALDALGEGFAVRVDRAGVRGVDVEPGDSERALDELRAAGATVA